jgi:competence protein ComEA
MFSRSPSHGPSHRGLASRFIASFAAIVIAWFAMVGIAAAAVEANSADQSQLETVKGIGPSLSTKILAARKQGNFKDWSDLQGRVSGIGEKNSAGFSRNGLTVSGRAKDGADAAPDGARSAKATAGRKGESGTTLAASTKK